MACRMKPIYNPPTAPNLFVLTSGQISIGSRRRCSREMRSISLSAKLKEKFDFILFDAAPVMDFP